MPHPFTFHELRTEVVKHCLGSALSITRSVAAGLSSFDLQVSKIRSFRWGQPTQGPESIINKIAKTLNKTYT